jgi:hypothetical protein
VCLWGVGWLRFLDDKLEQGLLSEQRLASLSRFVRAQHTVAVGVGAKEEATDEQIAAVDGLFL